MKKILLLCVIFPFFLGNIMAQCKPANENDIKRFIKYYGSELYGCELVIDSTILCTKERFIYQSSRHIAYIRYIKSEADYYIWINIQVDHTPEFEMRDDNRLIFTFNSETSVSLNPCGDLPGNKFGLFNYAKNCIYKIDKDQLERIASNNVIEMQIQYTETKKGTLGRVTLYIEKKLAKKNSELAACILQQ